jgi:streptogramin lyase
MDRTRPFSITALLVIVGMGLAMFLPVAMAVSVSASTTATESGVPASGSCLTPSSRVPGGSTADPGGHLMYGDRSGNGTRNMNLVPSITEYPVPTPASAAECVRPGPDGKIWFAEADANQIAKITTSGTITEYPVPTAAGKPWDVAAGPDGRVWFTEVDGNKIGRSTTSGSITEFTIPTSGSRPWFIVAGPDGNLWFTEVAGNNIGKITTSGSITEYPVPTSSSQPDAITMGPDGNLWFGEFSGNKIGKINPSSGHITEYTVPTSNSEPGGIIAGPDGNLWFTELNASKIGMINPTSGQITEYPIPTASSQPNEIVSGPDGNVWFTEFATNIIGKINPWGGSFTEYTVPTPNSGPNSITLGPDDALWFTELTANQIGRARITNASSFYFAEGTTRPNFDEYLCIGNPNNIVDADANVTYIFTDGTTKNTSYHVPHNSRYTVKVNDEVGADKDVSIRVLSDTANLIAERPMYFNYKGMWTGGSDAVGASPNTRWYFAEGNTLSEFDQYVTVLNPGSTTTGLTFHFMVEGSGEENVHGSVGPHSRATFKTKDQIGEGKNASLYLQSDQPVVAERPMYFNYQGLASNNWNGGHDAMGTNSPARDWYFAEGTTRNNDIDGAFEQWLCLQNPGKSPIKVNATYQLAPGQGGPISKTYTVPGQQRLTVSVNREIGTNMDDSVHLNSTSDFIAERPMYFNFHNVWTGGHDVLGANSTARTWFFAEGTTRADFDEWLCLQNPGNSDAHTAITYYSATGAPVTKSWTVQANTRLTVSARGDVGPDLDISAKVASDQPIIVERPIYFNYIGVWTGGHDVVGFAP